MDRLAVPQTGGNVAHTYGWDTVSAVRVGDMNEAIALAGTSPPDFAQSVDGFDVSGRFGDWRIGAGGDGKLVHMLLPLRSVQVVNGARRDVVEEATAEISLRLDFVPHEPERLKGQGAAKLLKLVVATASPKPVSVIEIEYPSKPSLTVRTALTAALDQWLGANLARFRHVFACVSIENAVADAAFEWLKPSYASYAFAADDRNPEQSVFAILCMTAGRSPDDLIVQIGPDAIPGGSQAGFLISRIRFVQDMLSPAVRHAYLDRPSDAKKTIVQDEEGISFAGSITLDNIESDGKTYSPTLEKLTAKVHQRSLFMETVTRTWVSPGIWSMTKYGANYRFGLIRNSKQQKTLGYDMIGEADNESWPEHSTGIIIAEIILAIIGVIAGIVLAVSSAGLLSVPAAVLAITIAGAIDIAVSDLVACGDGPPISLMLANATDAVEWAHGSVFEPDVAGLNGALQFGGTLGTGSDRLGAERNAARAFQARFGALEEIDA